MTKIRQPFGADVANVGAIPTLAGLTVTEQGDATYQKTILHLKDVAVGAAAETASLAFGKLLYTLPAGVQVIEAVNMDVTLTGATEIAADTPDVGIGSVIGTGAIATLTTATMEDYVTGQTSGVIDGTNAVTKLSVATAGAFEGIAINEASDAKTIHLNVADGWADAGAVTATGTVTILWRVVA